MKFHIEKYFSQLISGIKSNKNSISIQRSKTSSQILSILQSTGFILSYRRDNDRFVAIPRYTGVDYRKIHFFSKNACVGYSYKALLRFSLNKGPCVMILHNSWLGVVTNEVALRNREGGRLLCIIYF